MSQPLVVGNGRGVDSMAMIIGLKQRGIRPDRILFADTGGEKEETYLYAAIQAIYLEKVGFPQVVTVAYSPTDFKHWPPYYTLEENCLTNGTLPSLAFGFGSCSQKWKAAPQERDMKAWQPAIDWWAQGGRVRKAIGYDDSKRDRQRRTNAGKVEDPKYEYWYPLQEWHWDREKCVEVIVAEQLPGWDPCYLNGKGPVKWVEKGGIPLKSSCFYCPAMKTWEVRQLPKDKLRRIVIMEARAKPRLESIDGLWRTGCKGTRGSEKKPGAITEFIRSEELLPEAEIDKIISEVPKELMQRNEDHAAGQEVESWPKFFESHCGE